MYSFLTKESFFANIDLQKEDVFFFPTTDSTNEQAREHFLCGAAARPALFIAKEQTRGKGTRGRSFDSGEGGLYFSLLIPIEEGQISASEVTPLAAAAVSYAVKKLIGKSADGLFIKWVNDLFIKDRKICGILCERVNEKGKSAFIVGIGINLLHREFPSELSSIASSIEDMTGERILPEEILPLILGELIDALVRKKTARLKRIYRKHFMKKGVRVTVTDGLGISRNAEILGLYKDLSLKVLYDDGERAKIISGDLSIKL